LSGRVAGGPVLGSSSVRKRFWALALLTLAAPLLPWRLTARAPDPRCLPPGAADRAGASSNVLPGDYVGPAACAECHRRKYDLWSGHPHRTMNQLPTEASVRGDFAGAVLRLGDAAVTFSRAGGVYQMAVERGGRPLRRYEVTRTVGTRFMQFYVGVQREGPEPAGHPAYHEHMLPFAYWLRLGRWLPKHYFDPDGPEELRGGTPRVEGVDGLCDVRPYTGVCMKCHTTYPYAYRIFDPMLVGFRDATVAAAVGPLAEALAPSVAVEPSARSFADVWGRLDPDRDLVTLGISCESCHFGGREHAREGGKVHFVPTSPYVRVLPEDPARPVSDDRKDPAAVNGICTQCHTGNAATFPNCAGQTNSREALDFRLGACASQLRCVSCHEPHTAGPPPGSAVCVSCHEPHTAGPPPGSATDPAHLALCVRCHSKYREPERALAHGRHAPGAADCLDCHMPRYAQGLDGLVRSHKIGPPVEQPMASAASANACNVCHLDRTLRWTLDELERGWGRRLEPPPGGDAARALGTPMGDFWLRGPDTALRLVAGQSYARSSLGRGKLPELLVGLNDPEPINRVFALLAVEQVWGRKLGPSAYELTAPPAARARQIEALREALGKDAAAAR
jgi:predicted CXXCH cytochrome family protein